MYDTEGRVGRLFVAVIGRESDGGGAAEFLESLKMADLGVFTLEACGCASGTEVEDSDSEALEGVFDLGEVIILGVEADLGVRAGFEGAEETDLFGDFGLSVVSESLSFPFLCFLLDSCFRISCCIYKTEIFTSLDITLEISNKSFFECFDSVFPSLECFSPFFPSLDTTDASVVDNDFVLNSFMEWADLKSSSTGSDIIFGFSRDDFAFRITSSEPSFPLPEFLCFFPLLLAFPLDSECFTDLSFLGDAEVAASGTSEYAAGTAPLACSTLLGKS